MAEGPSVQLSPLFRASVPTRGYSAAWDLGRSLAFAPAALGDPNKAKFRGPISSQRSKWSPNEMKNAINAY